MEILKLECLNFVDQNTWKISKQSVSQESDWEIVFPWLVINARC
jgi:hypothetical protein